MKINIMNPSSRLLDRLIDRVTENMSMMQSAGRRKRSPVDNIIVACSIMERNETQNNTRKSAKIQYKF